MKQLKEFISEKLQISSKSKVKKNTPKDYDKIPKITNNYAANKVLYSWGFWDDTYIKDLVEVVLKWAEDNHISDVKFFADLETKNTCTFIEDEILNQYDFSYNMNEECQWRLGSAKSIFDDKAAHVTIMAAPDIIAYLQPEATLYSLPVETL